ncbi:MAG: protein kinase, partial [Phycisphaeraceae bacterium]|nr:protein kinase [Phycisphaeraceae bacterium]
MSTVRCPRCKKTIRIPAAFAAFEVYELIGHGTSGNVYRAYNKSLRRNVALKILSGDPGEKMAESCIAEARALAALNHPNVVQVYTIGNHRNRSYIEMELVDGGSAEKYLQHGYQLTEVKAMDFAIAVTRGLRAAYQAGLIHMDVKPANILLTEDEVPKLIDFGAARFIEAGTSDLAGTPYYVAPEVVRGKKPDFKADLYGLGSTLFHLFTGRPPFDGKTSIDVLKKKLAGEAPSMLACCNHIHPETAEVVAWMLQLDPARRYESYDELIDAFEAARKIVTDDPLSRTETFWFDRLQGEKLDAATMTQHLGNTWGLGTAGKLEAEKSEADPIRELSAVAEQPSKPTSAASGTSGRTGVTERSENTAPLLLIIGLLSVTLIGLLSWIVIARPDAREPVAATSVTEPKARPSGNPEPASASQPPRPPSPTRAPALTSQTPVAHWAMGPRPHEDLSGSGHDLNPVGDLTRRPGPRGFEAPVFSNGHLFAQSPRISETERLTVTSWVHRTDANTSGALLVATGPEGHRFEMRIEQDGSLGYKWQRDQEPAFFKAGPAVPPKQWVFVSVSLFPQEAVLGLADSAKTLQIRRHKAIHGPLSLDRWTLGYDPDSV